MKRNIIELVKILLTVVFVTLSTAFLFAHSTLKASEDLFKEENIINTIKELDIIELIGEDKKQEIYAILEKAEIPTEYIDAMLKDEALKEQVGKYIVSSVDYLKSLEEVPKIDEDEVTNILVSTFDRVIKEAEKHNIEVNTYISEEQQIVIHEKIEYYVPEIIEKIPEIRKIVENKIKESSEYQQFETKMNKLKKIMNIVNRIYEYKWVLLIATIIPLIIIVIMKWKNFKFVKWLAITVLFVSFLLKLLTIIIPHFINEMFINEVAKIKTIISPSIDILLSNINRLMITYFEIGIAIIIIEIGINIYKKTLKNGE